MKRAVLFALALSVASCGGGEDSPTVPTLPTPSTARVEGVWAYSSRFTSVTGPTCATLRFPVGAPEIGIVSIQQTGPALTGTATTSTGATCGYTGTADASSLTLNWTRCDIRRITGRRCADGAVLNMDMLTRVINATVSGPTANGTAVQIWQVTNAVTGAALGLITVDSSFTANRR